MGLFDEKNEEIKKVLKNPVQGFFNMSHINMDQAIWYKNNLKVGDVLVYRIGERIDFYEITRLAKANFNNLDTKRITVIDGGKLLPSPIHKDSATFDLSEHLLLSFICVLRKDPRKFEVVESDYVDGYNVKVDGVYEATPTGRIKLFGTEDFARGFVKELAAGTKEHTKHNQITTFSSFDSALYDLISVRPTDSLQYQTYQREVVYTISNAATTAI